MENINQIQGEYLTIFKKEDFYCLWPQTGHGLLFNDPRLDCILLAPDISVEALGTEVRGALRQSTALPLEEFEALFNSGDVQRATLKWEEELSRKFEYKTRRAFFKNMKKCLVRDFEGQLSFSPTRQDRLDGWQGLPSDLKIFIPSGSANEAVGEALLKAFERCE